MDVRESAFWLSHRAKGGAAGAFLRFAALGAALFILLGMLLVARLVFRGLGFADADEFLFGENVVPDFRRAAIAESQWHAVRYGLIFAGVAIIGLIRRRLSPASYGLSLGGRSLPHLILFGVGAYFAMHVPSLALSITDRFFDIGPGTPFWALMDEVPWDRDFWLYMAVSSFAVVPLVEETMARGYMLGRFRESFSPGAALIVMGLIFSAAHTQYHKADVYAVGQLVALVWGSVILGYAVYRTGSLVPPVIAHGLVNIPMKGSYEYLLAGLLILVLILFRRSYGEHAARLWRIMRDIDDWLSLALIAAVVIAFGATLQATPWAPYAWLGGFSALFVASLFVRSAWARTP